MTNLTNLSREIISACQRIYQRNMLAAADGNVSVRMDDNRVMITPSGKAKAFIQPEDMAIVDLEGNVLQGNPSGERIMHLEVYKRCPKAKAVVHAHPPHAIAWSVSHPELKELPAKCLSEVILACGSIPFVEYARPTTKQMADRLQEFLPKHRALILSRHGALAWGETLDEAINGMERIEHSSQILFLAKQLGKLTELPKEEVDVLYQMREKLGERLL